MRRGHWCLVVAALLSVSGCSDNPVGAGDPSGGTLLVHLTTAHADDGAVLFALSGSPIDTVVAVNASLRLFTRRTNDSTILAAVVGAVADGAVVTLRVPDVGAAARYTARIVEVADRDNVLRASLTGYTLTVAR